MAPIYTNFEGERAPKKNAIFLSKFFKKCPKTAFLTVFLKICLRRRKFCQNRGKRVLWETSKNQFGRPKKKKSRQNFGKFFENPPPPRENPRSAPGSFILNTSEFSSECCTSFSQLFSSFYQYFSSVLIYRFHKRVLSLKSFNSKKKQCNFSARMYFHQNVDSACCKNLLNLKYLQIH